MFERWTERARQVIVLAQEEARRLKHSYIGTEHLLLGLLLEREGIAARVLEDLGVSEGLTRESVKRICGADVEVSGQIPFTPRAKKVIEVSLREALSLGHNYIGTEHVLLALAREGEGVAARILLDADVDSEAVRRAVVGFLAGSKRSQPVSASTYTVAGLRCGNCNWKQSSGSGRLEIPLGQLVGDTSCPVCGCGALSTPVAA